MKMTFIDSDITILDILRKRGGMTVSELSETFGVTGTAVRQRLNRLLEEGDIHRERMETLRGRPRHRYLLTTKGRRRRWRKLWRSSDCIVAGNTSDRQYRVAARVVAASFWTIGTIVFRKNPRKNSH